MRQRTSTAASGFIRFCIHRHMISFIMLACTTNWRRAGFLLRLLVLAAHNKTFQAHSTKLVDAARQPRLTNSRSKQTFCQSVMQYPSGMDRLRAQLQSDVLEMIMNRGAGKYNLTVSICSSIIFTNLWQNQTGTTMPCCLRHSSQRIISNLG